MFKQTTAQALVLCLASAGAQAANEDPVRQLIDILRANGSITTEQHAVLSDALAQKTAASPPAPVPPPDDNHVMVRTEGGIEVTTIDGEFSAELGGTLMLDAAHYQDKLNPLGSGTELRKGEISLSGRLFGTWLYEFEVDLAGESVDINDAYLAYTGFAPWRLTFGQHKQPFSLDELTGSSDRTFMERALPNALTPGHAIGASAAWRGEQLLLQGGLFAESVGSDPNDENDEGWDASARLVFAPFAGERRALHLGIAATQGEPDQRRRVIIDQRPESHITGIKFLDTGNIKDVTERQRLGVEAAWVQGPFSLQGEWMQTSLERDGDPDLTFSGWYTQASWFITGESRNYDSSNGTFDSITPRSQNGAVEIAARISELDLNDADIEGGQQRNLTLGVNWYLNEQVRLMLNYIRVDSDIHADADGDVTGDDDFELVQMRLQADF